MGVDDEKAFIKKLVSLDSGVWETVCREISPMLFAYVQASFDCGLERAEEVVQRALVRSVRSIGRYDARRGRFLDWLRGICRNEAITFLKREAREIRFSGFDDQVRTSLEQIDESPIPEEVIAHKEVQWLIYEIVYELRPSHRQVLILKYLKGKTVSEMAVMMSQSNKAVESLLTRARQAFRTDLLARCEKGEVLL